MWYEYQYKRNQQKIYRNRNEQEFYAVSYWGFPDFEFAQSLINPEEVVEIDDAFCYYTQRELNKEEALFLFKDQCSLYYYVDKYGMTNREYILANSGDFK